MKMTTPLRRVLGQRIALGGAAALALVPLLWSGAEPADAVSSAGPSAEPAAAANKYIGSKKCKNCHDADASGNQWDAWNHAGHANAFKALLSDEAKKIAKEQGIKDASKSDKCLKCHVTAFGEDKKLFKKSFNPEFGVGCETCHGPGNDHARARFKAANEEDDDEGFGDEEEEATYTQIPDGEILMNTSREVCLKCHNDESPTYKPFCYYKRLETIRHLNPLKPRTDKERAEMLVCGCGDDCKCDGECVKGCGVPPKKKK